MKVNLTHIPVTGAHMEFKHAAREFIVLKEMIDSGQCQFMEPIVITLDVELAHDLVRVKGDLRTKVQLHCSRCLQSFEDRLAPRFTLRFSRKILQDLHAGEEGGIELTADQVGLIYFEDEELDLKDAIQEQVVLAMPYKPLCQKSCRGLCPQCGADLNLNPCQCSKDTSANPFAVLKKLNLPSQ